MMFHRYLTAHAYAKKAVQRHAAQPHGVLFDGICHLCTTSVQFIITRDPNGYFVCVPSVGGWQNALEAQRLHPDALDTFVLIKGSRCFTPQ